MKVLYLAPLFLTGCAVSEWLVNNSDNVEAGAEVATEVGGPYGAILGLGATTALGIAKWWEHKSKATEVIKSVQKAKQDLPEGSKKLLSKGFEKTPEAVKKYVSKVKKKLQL